ncbi:fibroblast growth factor receptor-like [Dendronephthya gigantea]|uniref:fibroblast growth factor receptor-like n=1 Tax=Dendronephthya gigantea TaxID=151771 RepID=UPI00106ADFBE|nr:fibroblast growth factor receptor-like [Dendronephthya gigantea]
MALPAVNQFLSLYHVALPFDSQISYSITIVIEKENVDGLHTDGLKLSDLDWKGINASKYVWTVINLPDLSKVAIYHTSSSVKFGLIVFGWNYKSSFGYPGGYDLNPLSHGPSPGKPRNVSVAVDRSIMIVKLLPTEVFAGHANHYLVSLRKNGSDTFGKPQVATSPFIHDFGNESGVYTVKIEAVDIGIVGEAAYYYNITIQSEITQESITPEAKTSQCNMPAIAGGLAGTVTFVGLAVIIYLFLMQRRNKGSQIQMTSEYQSRQESEHTTQDGFVNFGEINEYNVPLPGEISYITILKDWEICPDRLQILDETLGSGQFGIVKLGLYTSLLEGHNKVAVKMLKENATELDLSDLITELETLKRINNDLHPNIVRLIGCCFSKGKLMVVTEYCSPGNLQTFLRKSKVGDNSTTSDLRNVQLISTVSGRELLKMGLDVASGMVHLSDLKFVHRDLAARNILLSCDVAKISDFGLTRDIANVEEYIRTNQDLLPIKWMALESLLYGRFTVASDVWSFGVFLYELVTLGGEPYSEISPLEMQNHINRGCRFPKPFNCSNELYEIMMNCWRDHEKMRPNFSEIRQHLHDMLTDNQKSYINLHQVKGEDLRRKINI